MWKPLIIVLFALPTLVSAQSYILPSGLEIEIPNAEITQYEKEWKLFTLPSGLKWFAESIVHVPKAQASELSEKEIIKLFIIKIAQEYGLSETGMIKLAQCESLTNPLAHNKNDVLYSTGKPVPGDPNRYGLYQFSEDTFIGEEKDFSKIWDWREQTRQTASWIKKGYWKKWPWCINNIATELKQP